MMVPFLCEGLVSCEGMIFDNGRWNSAAVGVFVMGGLTTAPAALWCSQHYAPCRAGESLKGPLSKCHTITFYLIQLQRVVDSNQGSNRWCFLTAVTQASGIVTAFWVTSTRQGTDKAILLFPAVLSSLFYSKKLVLDRLSSPLFVNYSVALGGNHERLN